MAATVRTYAPFANRTAFLLSEWYWNSRSKSFLDFRRLISVFKDPAFSLDDAIDVDWKAAFKALGANKEELSDDVSSWIPDDGWKTDPVSLDIPFHSRLNDPGTKRHTIGLFRHRSIVSVIKEKLSCRTGSRTFHYYPYRATWRRTPDSQESELYGEMYTSRAFREAHEILQRQPPTSRDQGLERIVVALMFWSDGTQLTSFGGASLWPCYMFFGNDSKYERGMPSEQLGNQIAYFMKVRFVTLGSFNHAHSVQLPDKFNDYLKERNEGKIPYEHLLKYCKRQLFHQQWSILLDAEFLDAVKNGILVACPDGKERCFFPRIFSYSADYPEK